MAQKNHPILEEVIPKIANLTMSRLRAPVTPATSRTQIDVNPTEVAVIPETGMIHGETTTVVATTKDVADAIATDGETTPVVNVETNVNVNVETKAEKKEKDSLERKNLSIPDHRLKRLDWLKFHQKALVSCVRKTGITSNLPTMCLLRLRSFVFTA